MNLTELKRELQPNFPSCKVSVPSPVLKLLTNFSAHYKLLTALEPESCQIWLTS